MMTSTHCGAGTVLVGGSVLPTEPVEQHAPSTVIEPGPLVRWSAFAELWHYRELLFFLAWRDIKVRYRQTLLGAAWAFIQPVVMMAVFVVFLGRVAQGSATPYPLFVLSGLVPWMFFSNTINAVSQSVVSQRSLITRTYVPRLLIPLGAVGAPLVDFLISSSLLVGLLCCCGYLPGWSVVLVPLTVGLLGLAALGIGTFLSALVVSYRDVRYLLPFLLQLGLFATPCVYLGSGQLGGLIPEAWLGLNPAFGLISALRASLLDQPIDWSAFGLSAATAVALGVAGCLYFIRAERNFADVI